MNAIQQYLHRIHEILTTASQTQGPVMEEAATLLAATIANKNSVYAFGTNHAGILAQELYYRTGGLVVVNYVMAPGLNLDITPPTLTTAIERMVGYGEAIATANKMKAGDLLICHSVSGRNSVTVELAEHARRLGMKTICLTNMNTTTELDSRAPSGKRLFEVCDIVIDNCGDFGDSTLEIDGFADRIAPSSTAVGAAILNAVVAGAIEKLVTQGITPPVFMSSNVPGGDEHNAKVLEDNKDRLFYL